MAEITDDAKAKQLIVYLPDTRGTRHSRYGNGNLKIGLEVKTYSRLPGKTGKSALGIPPAYTAGGWGGTCPGATDECQRICYAERVVEEMDVVAGMWLKNSMTEDVPPIPPDIKYLRLHVSGDFTSPTYIWNWIKRLQERPEVKCWVYTRSWRVPDLMFHLERMRALPNVQMFASIDISTPDHEVEMISRAGWRRAWIDGDPRAGTPIKIMAHTEGAVAFAAFALQKTDDGVKSLICPEETKAVANCVECGFCIAGNRNDVTFLQH